MIKFFRKIRQNLLMENKISKYFKDPENIADQTVRLDC